MANSSKLKKENMMNIIETVRKNGQITKPELAKITNLTLTTVHNFVNELVEAKVVLEEGSAISNGGRRAQLYSFNGAKYYVIGVSMTLDGVEAGIYDLHLNCIESTLKKVPFEKISVDTGMQAIIQCVRELLKTAGMENSRYLGIGINVPGPVNIETGVVLNLSNLPNWRAVGIKSMLENELGINVLLDKDTCACALALKWIDDIKDDTNVVFITLIEGVGSALILGGRVYRGKNCMSGELGHISINPDGPICNCKNTGCLEFYASDLGIVQRMRKRMQNGEKTSLNNIIGDDLESVTMEAILQAYAMGDEMASQEIEVAAKYIAVCINNAIKLYDPDKIVIGHRWLNNYPRLYAKIVEDVFCDTVFAKRDAVEIDLCHIPNVATAGGAAMVIENEFVNKTGATLIGI